MQPSSCKEGSKRLYSLHDAILQLQLAPSTACIL